MNFIDITKKIENTPSLDFGGIINRSIELFKKVWVQGFITLLLTFVCISPLYIICYAPFIVLGISDPEMLRQEEPNALVILLAALIFPLLFIGLLTVSLALMAAFFRICKQKDENEQGTDDYFFYFKNGRISKVVVLAALYFGLMILGMAACFVGLFYLMVPLSLLPVILAFNEDLSSMEIVKASFRLGNKNWLVIFGLLVVMGIVAELGVILCFVGVFFTAMLAKIPVYYMYKDGVGFSEKERLSTHN